MEWMLLLLVFWDQCSLLLEHEILKKLVTWIPNTPKYQIHLNFGFIWILDILVSNIQMVWVKSHDQICLNSVQRFGTPFEFWIKIVWLSDVIPNPHHSDTRPTFTLWISRTVFERLIDHPPRKNNFFFLLISQTDLFTTLVPSLFISLEGTLTTPLPILPSFPSYPHHHYHNTQTCLFQKLKSHIYSIQGTYLRSFPSGLAADAFVWSYSA